MADRGSEVPLCTVVDENFPKLTMLLGKEVSVPMALLECGHTLTRATGFWWERHPTRRRCHKCAKGKPPDFLPPKPSTEDGQAAEVGS